MGSQDEEKDFSNKEEQFGKAFGELADKMLKQGMSPKQAMGLSSTYLENIYAQAYRLYNAGKYSEAIHLFRILIILNAMEPKYVLGLASCSHMMKEYYDAIQSYTMASALDPKNPLPFYHSSDCFIQTKDFLSAMLCLELAIDKAGEKPEFAKMKERAQLTIESLKGKITASSIEEIKPLNQEAADRDDFNII